MNSLELSHRRLHSTGSGLPPGINSNGFPSGNVTYQPSSGNFNPSIVGGLASSGAFPTSTDSSFSSQQRTQVT